MIIHWQVVPFRHACGLEGTILEVCVSADGCLALRGICIVCGEEFTTEKYWDELMMNASISDYRDSLKEVDIDDLEFPKGKVN